MKLDDFKKDFRYLNSVLFEDLILFSDYEVYNRETEESTYYNSLDEALLHKYKNKTILQRIEALQDLNIKLDGGRGSGSGESRGLFGDGGGGGSFKPDLPARMNRMYNGNMTSQSNTLGTFRNAHATAKEEHLVAMDDDGFVSTYQHGGKSSVGFTPNQVAGKHVIHNHPGGSHFSKADLQALASTDSKSITATSRKMTVRVEKGKNFDAKGFSKALDTAKTTQTDYNKAVDRFLKSNQKKYGYKYTKTDHE